MEFSLNQQEDIPTNNELVELPQSKRLYRIEQNKTKWYLDKLDQLVSEPSTFVKLEKELAHYLENVKPSACPDAMQKAIKGELSTWNFLENLSARNQLDKYLTKTISYIYMRDLGLNISEASSQKKIRRSVNRLVKQVEQKRFHQEGTPSLSFLHPWIAQHNIDSSYHWLMVKLANLQKILDGKTAQKDGLRKLVKVIAGILMHHVVSSNKMDRNDPVLLNKTIKLGYAYGLTYPFIDDLLDSNSILDEDEKVLFTDALRQTLNTGKVTEYPFHSNKNHALREIYSELKWAFEFIQSELEESHCELFFNRASLFFEAQADDRERKLSDAKKYDLNELLASVIIKSASSRLISRDIVKSQSDENFDFLTYCFGIYNQFNDDIKDIEEDQQANNLTPYTWYLEFVESEGKTRQNPYHYYWAVVYFLIFEVYDNDSQVKSLIFERSLNAHRSVFKNKGRSAYALLCTQMLCTENKSFNHLLHSHVLREQNEIWFDKLISTEVSNFLDCKREQKESFKSEYDRVKTRVESLLPLSEHEMFDDGQLHEIANYSLLGSGKRMRAVVACIVSEQLYGFNEMQQVAVTQLLEYMHTASLILDDLPSQDNAELRRGQSATHVHCNSVAKAELSSVYLMMKAIEVQADIKCHPPQAVLNSLKYAASVTQAICEGQWLDIETVDSEIDIASLEKICFFKTALAIEAALVIPAILADKDETHIAHLKGLAKHMGLMFQIRDDLLDECGDTEKLGKPVQLDELNKRANLVTVYGHDKAIKVMFEHYHEAKKIVGQFPEIQSFFDALFDFIIYRTK